MELDKVTKKAVELNLIHGGDTTNLFVGWVKIESTIPTIRYLLAADDDEQQPELEAMAFQLAVRSIAFAETVSGKTLAQMIADHEISLSGAVMTPGAVVAGEDLKVTGAVITAGEPKTEVGDVTGPAAETKEVSYEEKHGYAPSDTIIKTLINFAFDETWSYEAIASDALEKAVKDYKLDEHVVFDGKTGSIVNGTLPKVFQFSNYKKEASGKLVLKLRGYHHDDETKNLGTDKVLVKIFDGTVLNKMKDKKKTMATFDGQELSVEELLQKSSLYLLGQDKGPKVVLAIYEKEL